jgi:hypothetical protein
MGFPMERVGRTCQALGEDAQLIIQFCILVDQFVEKEEFPEKEASENVECLLQNVLSRTIESYLKHCTECEEQYCECLFRTG